jgi:hypothetical protein
MSPDPSDPHYNATRKTCPICWEAFIATGRQAKAACTARPSANAPRQRAARSNAPLTPARRSWRLQRPLRRRHRHHCRNRPRSATARTAAGQSPSWRC